MAATEDDRAIDELLERAVAIRESLRPAPQGFVWRPSLSESRRAAIWGYSDEQVSLRLTWTLECRRMTRNEAEG